MTDYSDSIFTGVFCIIGFIVLIGFIALLVYLIKKSNEESKQSEIFVQKIFQDLPQEKQMMFLMQYNSQKKNPTIAVLLALFLGGLGGHKFYMGQTGLGIVYILFCWTYIPALIALVEAITISGQVGKYNQQKATEIAAMLTGRIVGSYAFNQ